MKSTEELKELFEAQLKPALESMEGERKSLLLQYVLSLLGIFMTFALLFFFAEKMPALFYGGIALIGLCIFFIYKAKVRQKGYRLKYKENVVKEILRLINPDWDYHSEGRISERDYQESLLFRTTFDRYRGDDMVKGVMEKTEFEFSELHTEYKTYTTVNGKTQEEWHTIFKGLFAHADFNKKIKGRTFVFPDSAEKMFGKWGQNLQGDNSRGQLIKMENQEFEKLFVVHGSDQVESRYILTPTMMEAMVNIKKKYAKRDMHFSFIGSRVYVALSFNKDLFEPRILKSGVRFEDMEQMNVQFSLIQTIIRDMNLNTRIWTKD